MINNNIWHSIVSLPSNQKTISFNSPIILLDLLRLQQGKLRSQILIFFSFPVYFQRKSGLSWRGQPFRKKCRGRARWYWYRWHWKLTRRGLEDLLRVMFIHEECGNLKVFVGSGELTRNNEKKKPGGLQTYRFPLCDKCFMGEYFCSKHVEYCESVK